MKRANYRLDSDYFDIVEITSEWLLVEYIDDDNNKELRLESNKQRKEWEDGDSR